jgi:hypothetical protein
MKVEKCQSIAKSGNPCGATVVADGMCAWHAPSWADRRRQWSAEGGRKRSNASRAKKQMPELMTTDEVAAYLGVVFRQLITHRTEPAIATAAAAVARAMIAVAESAAIEQLQRDVEELKRAGSKRWPA